jgi:GTP cyclohydrolase I
MTGVDRQRIEAAVTELLLAIGENPQREGLQSTPQRVSGAYAEFFAGITKNPLDYLRETVPVGHKQGEIVLLRNISFRSVCEHHLLPFLGKAHIAYLPGERIVGLGRIPRVVDTVASRPQIQERLTEQIADVIDEGLKPRGVLVVIDAEHGCVTTRGVRRTITSTVTVASRGELINTAARAEIMTLIGAPHA